MTNSVLEGVAVSKKYLYSLRIILILRKFITSGAATGCKAIADPKGEEVSLGSLPNAAHRTPSQLKQSKLIRLKIFRHLKW